MNAFIRLSLLLLSGFLLTACSTAEIVGSWSNPDYKGKISNVYIIGIAKNDSIRRIFEDTFDRQLATHGVKAFSSYKDLPGDQESNKVIIIERMKKNGCDSVLLTKLIGQRKETVTTPGTVSGYSSGSYYDGRGGYGSWGNYYDRRSDFVYTPATTTEYTVLTIESVLYNLKNKEMIWSAQLETFAEGNINALTQDFVEQVTKDLKSKGLI